MYLYITHVCIMQIDAGLRGCDRILLYDAHKNRDRTVVERESGRRSGQVSRQLVDQHTLHKQLRGATKIG